MKALVTGAAGFVGRTLVERLLVSRHQVRGFVRTTSRVEPLRQLGIELCYGDLRDQESLQRAARSVDVVFHAAARVGVWGRPQEYYEANVLGTRHVLQAMQRSRVARLIHFSSVAVYGRNTGLIKETRALQRIGDAHGDTKIDAEEMVRESALSHGLAVTVLRPALVYGPFDYKYVPRTARNIVNGHMRIVGLGSKHRPGYLRRRLGRSRDSGGRQRGSRGPDLQRHQLRAGDLAGVPLHLGQSAGDQATTSSDSLPTPLRGRFPLGGLLEDGRSEGGTARYAVRYPYARQRLAV